MGNFHVVDSIMGSGKSQGAIGYIRAHPDEKFIVITPYLAEIKRFIENCPEHDFKEPENNKTSKSTSFECLLEKKENIITTHALFFLQAESIKGKYLGYTLIIDEAPDNVIYEINDLNKKELDFLFEEYLVIGEDRKIKWKGPEDYTGRFRDIKELAEANKLRGYSSDEKDKGLFTIFPVSVFEAFDEVFVLTYLLEGQIFKAYLDIAEIIYDYWYVQSENNTYMLIGEYQFPKEQNYKSLVNICSDSGRHATHFNDIGRGKYTLSKAWYIGTYSGEFNDSLSKNLYNYFKYKSPTNSGDRMWTTFMDYKSKVSNGRFKKNFVACNTRATNDYRNCTTLAYLVNRFMSPSYTTICSRYGTTIDNEAFALSEMIQWIWRSAIRDQKAINLYIPSERMRNILLGWLAYVAGEKCPEDIMSAKIYNWLKTAELSKEAAAKK